MTTTLQQIIEWYNEWQDKYHNVCGEPSLKRPKQIPINPPHYLFITDPAYAFTEFALSDERFKSVFIKWVDKQNSDSIKYEYLITKEWIMTVKVKGHLGRYYHISVPMNIRMLKGFIQDFITEVIK